nr:hypothetical protein [Tanacetum cinerariifolium]
MGSNMSIGLVRGYQIFGEILFPILVGRPDRICSHGGFSLPFYPVNICTSVYIVESLKNYCAFEFFRCWKGGRKSWAYPAKNTILLLWIIKDLILEAKLRGTGSWPTCKFTRNKQVAMVLDDHDLVKLPVVMKLYAT